MNTAIEIGNNDQRVLPVNPENIIEFPAGLLGFENRRRFVLISKEDEAPFMWLQDLVDDQQAFLVISPFDVEPDYRPDIADEDVAAVGIERPQDALLLTIVTLRADGSATMNLKGPILVNRLTFVGKQVIPTNSSDFAIHHRLPTSM